MTSHTDQVILSDEVKPFLTLQQLSERWQKSERTIREMMASGELAFYKLGGSLRFALADIEAFEEAHRHS